MLLIFQIYKQVKMFKTQYPGISILLPFLILPIIKKIKPKRLLKYSAISISGFLFLIACCVYYGMGAGKDNIVLVVGLITFLDCLVISSVMPLNIATQVFFQKILKMNLEVEFCQFLACLHYYQYLLEICFMDFWQISCQHICVYLLQVQLY